jgi:AcrR family transcriptional regulator
VSNPVPLKTPNGRLPRTARKAQLLHVALDVFAESGYHAAAMDEIAERAGVSKPVLYQHFPGKLDLYLALLETSVDTVINGVKSALDSTQDNRRRVQATMELWYDYVADRRAAFRLVFEADLTSDPRVRELVERVTEESAQAIAEVIREDTNLSPPASHLLAAGLVGIGHVSARSWMSSDSELSRDEAVQLAAGLAWRGIGGFPIHAEGEE